MSNTIIGNKKIAYATGGIFYITLVGNVRTIVGDNIIALATDGALCEVPLTEITDGTTLLQRSPASIIANYIILEEGLMTDPSDGDSWPMYISYLPDGPTVETNCGAAYDTTGVDDGRVLRSGLFNPHQGVQIRIRSQDYETGWAKIEAIVHALDAVVFGIVEIGTEEYEIQNASRTSPVAFMGMEPGQKRRYNFSVNYMLTIRELTV